MKPARNINGPWELRGYSDVVYAGDNVTSKIITGYIVLINGAIITCHFQIQKTVTLSVIEAEYSEITEVCCRILFLRAVLFFIGVVVKYSITAHVDNIEAILLLDNTAVSQQKKHKDVHHHFICDYIEDKTVKIQFVDSEENPVDSFTKNLSNEPFESIISRYVHHGVSNI